MRVTCVDARILLYEYKYAVRRCMPPLKPSVLAAPGGTASYDTNTTVNHWQRTASTTTLKILEDSAPPLFHPLENLKQSAVASSSSGHHCQSIPVPAENLDVPRYHSVRGQDIQTSVTV